LKKSAVRELRAVERFRLKLPVNLTWQVRSKQEQQGEGITRDISTRGMFVLARTSPPKGKPLRFEISLSPDELSPAIQVEGRGRVVRVERPAPRSKITGFAVVNLWFRVRDPQEAPHAPRSKS
jgi:PilZ domain